MAKINRLFLLVGLCVCVCCMTTAEGGTCQRITRYYRSRRVCTCWVLAWCAHRATRYYPVYRLESYCCPGYRGAWCNEPICNPPCTNGGTCVSPNQCECPKEFTGNSCQQVVCSHLQPCFPGTCTFPNSCTCQNGFRGHPHCLQMESEESPDITKASASLVFIKRNTKQELYRYDTDSSFPNVSTVDELWINERDFNYININMEAMYSPPQLQVPPRYVSNFGFGITGGYAQVILTKIPRSGDIPFVSKNNTYQCPDRSGRNPENLVYECDVTDENFDRILEHGDNMTVTVKAKNGGYRELRRLTDSQYTGTEYYIGHTSHKTMVYHFDFDKPTHCSENGTCSTKAFELNNDITKNGLVFTWGGWTDGMAGVIMYTWEVFKLAPHKYSKFLTEPEPMRPIKHIRLNASTFTYKYTPTEPGMFSFLLEVKDKANNSRYVRRLALYDPISTISINNSPDTKLFVGSAAPETMYKWQANLQNEALEGSPIEVKWNGHFANTLHENQKLLSKVLAYPKQDFNLITGSVRTFKSVEPKFEDNEGNRTLDPILNIHGIVKFDMAYKKDHKGGTLIQNVPESGWINVLNPMSESLRLNATRQDGDTIRIWIKAFDVMGNTKVDATEVTFDSTPPFIQDARMQRNVNSTYPFSSRVLVTAKDMEGGVYKVKWTIKDMNEKIFKDGEAIFKQTNVCTDIKKCYTVPMGDSFYFDNDFVINNCWMVVPKDKLETEILKMELFVFNMALISNGTELKIENLKTFAGMENYSGPMNVRVTKKLSNGVRLEWDQSPSCYERVEILIRYGNGQVIKLHKNANSYDLVGLNPEQNYTIALLTKYGAQLSNPVMISFVTEPSEGLSTGAIVGISLVMLILVGIIIVGIILWRTGRLNTVQKTIRRRLTKHSPGRSRNNLRRNKGSVQFNNLSYAGQADDIYLYGGMKFEETQAWQIPRSEITLEEKLCSGRFADIYKAKRETRRNDKSAVVTKLMKEAHTEQDMLLMQAKINFLGTKVGKHPNVLEFIGAVQDNEALGPFMVLEYCEEGTLKDWLDKKKKSATDDVVERLYRIVYDISRGMEYLASKQVVHRRLAARNVLLNSQLEAKVAGFGPSLDQDGDEQELNNKPERIPVKWMSPECMTSTKDANEASDVWSYAVVMWEVFSLGDTPYEGIKSRDVPDRVKSGYRMGRPEFCEDVQYNIMVKCWDQKPKKRPTFKMIAQELGNTFMATPSDEFYYYSEK